MTAAVAAPMRVRVTVADAWQTVVLDATAGESARVFSDAALSRGEGDHLISARSSSLSPSR